MITAWINSVMMDIFTYVLSSIIVCSADDIISLLRIWYEESKIFRVRSGECLLLVSKWIPKTICGTM